MKFKKTFDLEQTSNFFGVSLRTISNWVNRGLPNLVVGRERFFRLHDLKAWNKPMKGRPKKRGGDTNGE